MLVAQLPHLNGLTSHRWMIPVTCFRPLGRVPNFDRDALDARRHQEGGNRPGDVDCCDDEFFGDSIVNKNTHTLRLGFQNIGSFPRERNKIKEENIRIGISTYSFDIFGIVETNTDWRLVPEDLKLHSWLKH